MRYTDADLKNKILEMYPEIVKHTVGVDVKFDDKRMPTSSLLHGERTS